jgi:adenine deaminase
LGLEHLIAVARGDETADLVLANGRVINVVSGEIRETGIAVADGKIAALGDGYRGRVVEDLGGRYVSPGFIDAHVHVESSLVRPREFARAVVPRGVTTVVSNPHEIANVLGVEGIRFMLRDARHSPLEMLFTVPSSVPATSLSTSGASLTEADIALLLREPEAAGLGEVMDFQGVVSGERRVLGEIEVCRGFPVDGHCPGLTGRELNAYASAFITSEHECTTVEEAREKLGKGIKIFIREGSVAKNLAALLPLINEFNERWISFCTDDRTLSDLLNEGSVDHLVRMGIAGGLSPLVAIRMATINPAEHYRLSDRGVIAPGRRADLAIFHDLNCPRPDLIYCRGVRVSVAGGHFPGEASPKCEMAEAYIADTIHVDLDAIDFRIPAGEGSARVIGIVPDQLLTECLFMEPYIEKGYAVSDPDRDLSKLMVIERHRRSGRVGKGFVRGFGLRRGAIASSVAHDHHNLIVAGVDDVSMKTAARAVASAGGGQAVAKGDKILAILPLQIAGLMSGSPIEEALAEMTALSVAVRELGSLLPDPFMTLSFLGLEVIPDLKLTDYGLVDVVRQEIMSLFQTE